MTDSPQTSQNARKQLYNIIRMDIPFEEKARAALELGAAYLNADNGHLTRIDTETGHWEALVSTASGNELIPTGLELDLATTYCRRALESDSQIALHDTPNQGWGDDVAFATHGFNCYLGTTLVVEREPYGTVCFVAEEPRDDPFSDSEKMFAELVARLLERELERDQHEAALTRQANLSTVLNRVLRHNLRNDMSVIRGLTQYMADQLDNDRYGAIALNNIDGLIELSEKARTLETIVTSTGERDPTDIVAVVDAIVARVAKQYDTATVAVESNAEITASVFPSFERAIEELVDNALKHSGENPVLTVSVDIAPNAFTVHIVDNGPGLSDREAKVLESGAETPLTHGTGLGLWLTHWIVSNHDGSIDATVTEDGTTMTISIPRKPATDVQQQLTKLTRARDQYQAAFEDANDAMVILNDSAEIVDANPEAAHLFGVNRDRLLGRSILAFLSDDFDFESLWSRFKTTGVDRNTTSITAADGEEHTVEYSAKADIVPGQHLVISRDVTERIEREKALKNATERLEAIIEVSPDPILALSADGRIELWNEAAEAVFGFTAAAVVGEHFQSVPLHIEGDEGAVEELFKRALSGERIRNYEIQRQTKDGERIKLSLSTAPLRDKSGTITGIMAVAKDITDHIEADQQI